MKSAISSINKLDKASYTVTLMEDDLDMGSFVGVAEGYQITLRSGANGPYRIVNRRVSTESNQELHFTQVAGDLILENIILDGGNVGGGITVMPSNFDNPGSLTINDGTIIENIVSKIDGGGVIYTIGDDSVITMNGGIIRNNTSFSNG